MIITTTIIGTIATVTTTTPASMVRRCSATPSITDIRKASMQDRPIDETTGGLTMRIPMVTRTPHSDITVTMSAMTTITIISARDSNADMRTATMAEINTERIQTANTQY